MTEDHAIFNLGFGLPFSLSGEYPFAMRRSGGLTVCEATVGVGVLVAVGVGVGVAVDVGVCVGVFVGVGVGVGVGQYGSLRLLRSLSVTVLSPCGMHPVNLLDPASRRERSLVSFSRVAGMEPVSRLPLSPRCSKLTR